jgi:hypothetical protein
MEWNRTQAENGPEDGPPTSDSFQIQETGDPDVEPFLLSMSLVHFFPGRRHQTLLGVIARAEQQYAEQVNDEMRPRAGRLDVSAISDIERTIPVNDGLDRSRHGRGEECYVDSGS